MKIMALSANSIFKMTMTIRNLLRSSRYTTSVRLLQNSYAQFISEKGTSNILQPHPLDFKDTPDIMKQRNLFKWCENNSQVFQVVNSMKSMTGTEAVDALQALFRLDKKNNRPDEFIKERKEFVALCEIINKDLRKLSEGHIIDALKVLMHFEIPVTSIIMQSLLQIIRQSINTMSLEQITFVHYLLRKIKIKIPLVEALKMALPIVFKTHVKTKLDTENIDSLTNALAYLMTMNDDTESIQFVLDAINKRSDFDSEQAVNILISLYNIKGNDKNIELIEKVQKVITHNTDEINPSRLEFIIRKMLLKLKQSEQHFYNEGLIESIIQTVISKNVEVDLAIQILAILNKIRFASTSLLDYIAAKFYENKSLINELNSFQIINFFCAMSLADYKPIFFDSLKDLLLREKIFNVKYFMLLKAALFLSSLDCYWPKLLDRVFQNENCSNKTLAARLLYKDQRNLLLLHYAVSTFYPDYTGPLLSDDIIQLLRNRPAISGFHYPLKSALELSLGGPQYVKTHIDTDFAYYIDHLVIMRKGGFPVAINDENEPPISKLSDIKLIPDSQVLLFLYADRSLYARNTQRLTGLQLLIIKLLKSRSNYTVIPVLSDMWNSFTELEKTRYISQAIKLKSDKLSASINS